MKKFALLVVLLFSQIIFGQIDKTIREGILVNALDEKVAFINLTWNNGKASYTNAANDSWESLYETSIKSIQGMSPEDTEFQKISGKALKPKTSNASELYLTDLPEGIYETKEDFIKKIPSKTAILTPIALTGWEKTVAEDGTRYCFFYAKESKLRNVFAVVYKKYLYFQLSNVLKNRNKTDRAQDSDNPNAFARVVTGGENYLYLEAPLGNVWEKAFYVNYGVSTAMANHDKGIVWDWKNNEFNIFKNCEDYNVFIKDKIPDAVQGKDKCIGTQPNIFAIRNNMEVIK